MKQTIEHASAEAVRQRTVAAVVILIGVAFIALAIGLAL
jgi:hypothetical protein